MTDLTGMKFGKLTVTGYHGKRKRHNYWNCVCECGKNKIVEESTLKNKISCGCIYKNKIFNKLIGKTFGTLTVIKHSRVVKGHSRYICQCSCGNIKEVSGATLINNRIRSCGCLPSNFQTHGLSKNNKKLFSTWVRMKSRCLKKSNPDYFRYGGRGIKVCEEWINGFPAFYEWAINNGYADNLEIDRIDNNGNYEPSNCKWSTKKEQANNRRNNRLVTINGETKTFSQWVDIYGINPNTASSRVYTFGWDYVKAIITPARKKAC